MKSYAHRFVQYVVRDVDTEINVNPHNFVEHRLMLCAHDEMTAQANDTVDQYWVFEDEFRLQKKGAGHGLHHSDVICLTIGHLVEAGESLEYGKNYNGYWHGENFCNQRKLFLPLNRPMHGPGYQALFLIDNSQGHAAYAENALLISCMNINPGGKQAHM
ncbi:hypothetical protein M405DRAFT_869229 [Rhizopogon salebrosus TDB-379]|nr:hypothetical protein M405DRAFT_869229 [Rhizopogon salebrosus TDB-379]